MISLKKAPSFNVAILAALVLVLLRLIYVWLGPLDLSPDEAQYWDWSRTLDWSYYSKPPLVSWLIWLSTQIFGHTEVGVRFFSVLSISAMSLIAYKLVATWRSPQAGWMAFIAIHLTPLTAAGGLLMTPDAICTTLWLFALFLLSKVNWHKEGQWKLFLAIGLTIGLAGLAKYTAAVFYPLLGLYLLIDKQRRTWLLKPQIYAAGLLSLACVTPVLYWNMQNDWISFKHVAGQAGGTRTFDPLKYQGNFWGGQFGVVGPITFLFMLGWWLKQKRIQENGLLLWWFSAPLFALFVLKAFDAKVQANWPVLATATALIGLVGWIVSQPKWARKLFAAGMSLSLLVTTAAYDSNIIRSLGINLSAKRDPIKPLLGWSTLGNQISKELPENALILTTRYQTTASLGFYLEGSPQVLYMNPGYRRQNHYDLQPWPEITPESTVVYINEGNILEGKVKEGFNSCEELTKATGSRGNLTYRTATAYECTGYKNLERIKAEKF